MAKAYYKSFCVIETLSFDGFHRRRLSPKNVYLTNQIARYGKNRFEKKACKSSHPLQSAGVRSYRHSIRLLIINTLKLNNNNDYIFLWFYMEYFGKYIMQISFDLSRIYLNTKSKYDYFFNQINYFLLFTF